MGGTQDGEPMKDRGTSESGLHIASDGGATPVTRKLGLATSVDSTPMSHMPMHLSDDETKDNKKKSKSTL